VAQATNLAGMRVTSIAHPLAPRFLTGLGGATPILAGLGAAGALASIAFALRRWTIASGALALAVLSLLTESYAALSRGPDRSYFGVGAAVLGWLCGLAFARAARGPLKPPTDRAEGDEFFAEIGALAAICATYANASISKLTKVGPGWADDLTLRGVVLSQHPVGDASWSGAFARLVIEHPAFSQALSIATLVVQGGALLMLFNPSLRVAWGALLLAFHLNVQLLTGIGYIQSCALLVLFAPPWPAIMRRARLGLRLPAREATSQGPAIPDTYNSASRRA
jgi:hypothetical protein